MEELLKQMLEEAKKDKAKLAQLKMTAVKLGQMQLAGELRELERELFPESPEVTSVKQKAKKLNLVFRMVELNIPEDVSWLIEATIKKYWKRHGNFDLNDASGLICKRKEIFGESE